MTRRRSKAEVEMENLLGTLDPSSERFRVLANPFRVPIQKRCVEVVQRERVSSRRTPHKRE